MTYPATSTLAALCTDEDLAVWDATDFVNLAPKSQLIAAGTDGAFVAGSLWKLTSAAVPLSAQGVAEGHVAQLTKPGATPYYTTPNGDLLAVDSIAVSGATLRRLGQASSVGQPPAPTAGLTGVTFRVYTFGPQIALSSADIKRAYRLGIAGRALTNLEEHGEELRQTCVLYTLRRAYLTAQKSADGDYKMKLDLVNEHLSDLTARLQLRWGEAGTAQPPTTRFNTRILR